MSEDNRSEVSVGGLYHEPTLVMDALPRTVVGFFRSMARLRAAYIEQRGVGADEVVRGGMPWSLAMEYSDGDLESFSKELLNIGISVTLWNDHAAPG